MNVLDFRHLGGGMRLKVANVRSYVVNADAPKNLVFVRVETDDGVYGWGEAYTQTDRDTAITAHVERLGHYLIGRSPFNIKHFSLVAYEDFAAKRGAMDFWSALSAIEQALWDIVGKSLGAPVFDLLGGACRDKIRVYANGWSDETEGPDEYADAAKQMVDRGFTALKFDPFPGPWRLFISREDEAAAIETVYAVRDAVGSEIDLLIEVHRRLAPMHAVRVADAIRDVDPFWFEEPCPAENVDALAEVRSRTDIPIVAGETLYTKAAFRELFEKRAVDIINPDVCNTGGILETKEIAAMAEPYYVGVSPHNYNSVGVALASTVHVSACIPNFVITEYWVNFEPAVESISIRRPQVEGGYIGLPDEPGLGVDLDEDALERRADISVGRKNIRQYSEEGP